LHAWEIKVRRPELDRYTGPRPYTVLRRAARGQSDEGIDILATRPQPMGEETWLIQCKAYAPDRPVGVAKVRELLGALSDFAQRHNVQPRGLLATTSIFSAESTRLAAAHGIKLIDGTSLLAILEAENRRS
jgi:restriction endonuclease Mrr